MTSPGQKHSSNRMATAMNTVLWINVVTSSCFGGAQLLRRNEGQEVMFTSITWLTSLDAARNEKHRPVEAPPTRRDSGPPATASRRKQPAGLRLRPSTQDYETSRLGLITPVKFRGRFDGNIARLLFITLVANKQESARGGTDGCITAAVAYSRRVFRELQL